MVVDVDYVLGATVNQACFPWRLVTISFLARCQITEEMAKSWWHLPNKCSRDEFLVHVIKTIMRVRSDMEIPKRRWLA